jgi:hypothetical protein
MMKWSSEYIFDGLFVDALEKEDMLFSLLSAFRGCLDGISAWDSQNRLKLKVLETLVKCEGLLPASEAPVMLHVLLHVPDVMYRWNNPRNLERGV